ncbi:unnamed protein product [Acanthoscelides obtectus]|uniref:Uncharacterized protein n=1 Tax=Acanthoscelides obtectus TaxID=200917 RepID=A0A9P0MCP2_ACAOB|nr:unnamed protein product [Acanthoscelides obtectus]CAK1657879.1 hypothetical protein AOBTE_LOCUS20576 [Acanthoscelides obtectus]
MRLPSDQLTTISIDSEPQHGNDSRGSYSATGTDIYVLPVAITVVNLAYTLTIRASKLVIIARVKKATLPHMLIRLILTIGFAITNPVESNHEERIEARNVTHSHQKPTKSGIDEATPVISTISVNQRKNDNKHWENQNNAIHDQDDFQTVQRKTRKENKQTVIGSAEISDIAAVEGRTSIHISTVNRNVLDPVRTVRCTRKIYIKTGADLTTV